MKIGVLNEMLEIKSEKPCFADSMLEVSTVTGGNPAKGEALSMEWTSVRNMPVSVMFNFEKNCFVDRVKVEFSESTLLTRLVLKDEKDTLFTYSAETGKTISDTTVVLEAGSLCNGVELVVEGDFSDIILNKITFYGAFEEKADIFPLPKRYELGDKITFAGVFNTCTAACEEARKAAELLCDKYFEITDVRMSVVSDNGAVLFQQDASIGKDGYKLKVDADKAEIFASNLRGFVMGAECFIKLTSREGVVQAKVEDEPFRTFRGVHLYIPAYEDLEFTKRLVKYMISPLGYNNIIFNIAGGMEYESHPEINEAVCHAMDMYNDGKWPMFPFGSVAGGRYLKKETIRELLDYIRSFGISIIPEIQSLGHVQYLTQAFPEIAEIDPDAEKKKIDTRAEDAKPNEFYYHSYCPSNPKSYEIMYDIIDEVVDLFKPEEYVHMGHDEVYQLGVCPKCKDKDPAILYRDDVMKLYNHLKTKGMKMILWADMIQPVTHYASRPAIDMLPKDILLLDFVWYFWPNEDIELNLTEKGYTVGIGNLYSSHFPRYESRIRHDGVIGGQISTWTPTCEEKIQKEGKFFDIAYTANMLWSQEYAGEYRLTYDRIISRLMPYYRQNIRGVKYPSLTENAVFCTIVENKIAFPPASDVKQTNCVDVNDSFDSIIFCHTELNLLTKMPWAVCPKVAEYVLTYDDDTIESVPVTSSGNVAYWNRRQNQPHKHQLYRHNGYTAGYYADGEHSKTHDGRDVTIYNFEYILPQGKKLKTVELKQKSEYNTNVLLCKAIGVISGN